MSAHVTSPADPQVIVAGVRVDGEWHYMKTVPMDYAIALREAQSFKATPDAVAYMRAADDPSVSEYPVAP